MPLANPLHRGAGRANAGNIRFVRPLQHDDGKAKHSCGEKLGLRGLTTGIFADDIFDMMLTQQRQLSFQRERRASIDPQRIGQRFGGNFINAAHQIEMLWRGCIGGKLQPADRQENAAGFCSERVDGLVMMLHHDPLVARHRLPFRPQQREDGNLRKAGRFCRMKRHDAGEGVRGIHQRGDALFVNPCHQPFHASKPANSAGNMWQYRLFCAPRQRKSCADMRMPREHFRQFTRFCCSTKNENMHG